MATTTKPEKLKEESEMAKNNNESGNGSASKGWRQKHRKRAAPASCRSKARAPCWPHHASACLHLMPIENSYCGTLTLSTSSPLARAGNQRNEGESMA